LRNASAVASVASYRLPRGSHHSNYFKDSSRSSRQSWSVSYFETCADSLFLCDLIKLFSSMTLEEFVLCRALSFRSKILHFGFYRFFPCKPFVGKAFFAPIPFQLKATSEFLTFHHADRLQSDPESLTLSYCRR